jgi:sarcosine oxidase
MKNEFEYIVLGLGGIGSSAAYWLSRQAGSEVLGLEQFELGHSKGGSQDHSRIIRLSYHTPWYVEFARQAYEAWATLEKDIGEKLIVKTGGLDLWPENPAIPMSDYTESLTACKIPYDLLNANEIMKRWPQFRLTDDVVGLYQSEGGIAPAAKCNAAHQRMARENGATLRELTPVIAVKEISNEFEVSVSDATYRCRKLMIANGAWSNHTIGNFGLNLPLTVTQEQVTYFVPPRLRDFSPDLFPIWIWMDEPSFYGFPVFGEKGVKVAQDLGGNEVTAETRTFEPNLQALERVENFLKQRIPSAHGPVLYTKTCLYTLTPDRDFVIDSIPGQANAFIAIGAGHAFKYSSIIGRVLSELALDGVAKSDLRHFKIDRPILKEKNPTKSFLI